MYVYTVVKIPNETCKQYVIENILTGAATRVLRTCRARVTERIARLCIILVFDTNP